MTPKEKAQELVGKYVSFAKGKILFQLTMESAKQCALIAVDEMMEVYASAINAMGVEKNIAELVRSPFLEEVKQEIEKL